MSTTIDEKVVEMRFDNKQFESNVATSMSTLEKLKKKLNLSGASKGLEELNSAAKRVDMSGLEGAVDSVKARFSALDVVAVTALANITNSAVNAGKRLVASLSVDQVAAGWQKFADKTTSVATLVAQGNAIEDVNDQLDRLNWFTDETSYNFTDMVSNIAKFTATGKGLEESVTAMEGIATWAALSGQNAMTASRAMYQLSQAMGSGIMRKEDYKSIQNASMDTEEFRQKCLDAGVALGTLKDNGDGTYTSLAKGANATSFSISQFADHLTEDVWLTSDVMMQVFNEYSSAVSSIYEASEEKGMLASEVIDEIRVKADELKTDTMSDSEAIDAAIKELGYTLSDGSLKFDSFGLKAFEAAQKARTFSDAIDSVKDAVSTGWMNTFELIFGNAEQATELWTDVANQLWDVFAGGGERRNSILESTMTSGWDKLTDRIKEAGLETSTFEQKVKECAKSGGVDVDSLTKKYGSLSEAFQNGAIDTNYLKDAFDSLKSGASGTSEVVGKLSIDLDSIFSDDSGKKTIKMWDDQTESITKVQTALSELGYSFKKYGIDGKFGWETYAAVKEFQKASGLLATGIIDQDTINALKETGVSIKEIGENSIDAEASIDDLLGIIARPSGQELVFDIIHNSLAALSTVVGTFRDAWAEVFSEDRVSSGLYNVLTGIKNFSESLIMSDGAVEKFKNTLKGLISVFDIITNIAGGAVKFAFKALSTVLKAFNFNALDAASGIGNMLSKFRDWILENNIIGKSFDWLLEKFSNGVNRVKNWITGLFDAFKNTETFKHLSSALNDLGEAFSKFKNGEIDFFDLGYAISNFAGEVLLAIPAVRDWFNAFKETPRFQVWVDAFTELGNQVDKFRNGEIGILELAKAFGEYVSKVLTAIPIIEKWVNIFNGWIESFKNLPAVKQLADVVNSIAEAFQKLTSGEINLADFGTLLGENLAKTLASIPEIIKQVASGVLSGARQIASDFIEGFQNGISDKVSGVINSIVNFCINFVNAFREALGVHSPSWKAHDTAVDFFQGFINGAKESIGGVLNVLKKIGEQIVKVFKSFWDFITDESGNVEWGKIFAGGIVAGMLVFVIKITNAINRFSKAFSGIGDLITSAKGVLDNFSGVLKNFGKVLNGVAWDFKAKALLKIAGAIGILVAAIWLLAQIPSDKIGMLWNSVGVITALAVVLGILAFAMDKMSAASVKVNKKGASIDGLKSSLLQISIALLLLAATVKIIGGIDTEEAKKGFIGLAGIAVGLLAFLAAIGGVSRYSGDVDKLGGTMLKISLAMVILAVAMKKIAKMEPGDIAIGVAVLEAFVLFCVQLGVANRIAGAHGEKFGGNVLKIAAAMLILSIAMKTIAKMDPEDIITGIATLQMFVILIGEMAIINRLAGSNGSKFGGAVMGMSTSILILTSVIWLLSKVDESDVDKGIKVMQKFVLLVAELILVSNLAGKNSSKISANILAMSTAIGILAGVAVLLSFIDTKSLAKGIVAGSILGVIMALMIRATKDTQNVKGKLIAMTVAIGIMAGAVVALSFIDGDKLAGAVVAMDSLMLVFALMVKAANTGADAKGIIKTMSAMIGVVLVLAGIIAVLSKLDPKTVLPNALGLSALMIAISSSLFIMAKAGKMSKTVSDQLKPLVLVVAGLAAILAILSFLPNTESMISNAVALGVLLNLMASAMFIMAKAGKLSKTVSGQLGSLTLVVLGLAAILAGLSFLPNAESMIPNAIALGVLLNTLASALVILSFVGPNAAAAVPVAMQMGLVLGEIALVLVMLNGFNVQPSIETAASLSVLMLALSAACLLVSVVPAAAAINGAIGIAAFIGIIGGVVAALGLLTKIPGFSEVVAGGGEVLGLIGTAIGKFVGGIAGGVAAGIGSAVISLLPELGIALSAFMVGVQPFIELAGNVDSSVVAGAGYLSAAILVLTGASFISGVANILSLGQASFAMLGSQLLAFGIGAKQFFDAISGVDSSAIETANNVAGMILALTASECISSIVEKFGGSIDFSSMSNNLQAFGEAVVGFSSTISGKIDVSSVEAATNAGKLLVALNKSLPRSGGLVQDIIGEQDLERFATSCKAFAECIIGINETLSQAGFEVQSDKLTQLATAGTQFSDLNNSLPRSGGVAQDLAGEQDLAAFGTACSAFARCMISINQSISGNDFVVQSDKLEKLAQAGTNFSKLNSSLPRSGGIAQDLAGEQDLAAFGTACSAFASCMIEVNSAISQDGFSVNLEGMESLKQAGIKMNSLQEALPKTGGWWQAIAGEKDIGDFGNKIKSFADAIVNFSKSSAGLDASGINLAMSTAYRIKTLITSLAGLDASGIKAFTGVGTGGRGADGPAYKIAKAISAFSDEISGIDTTTIPIAITAANRLKTLIASLAGLDTSGVNDFKPQNIGSEMKEYGKKVSGIDTGLVSSSISSANRLRTFIASLSGLDTSGINRFRVSNIAISLKQYNSSVSGLNFGAINNSINVANRLKTFITSLAGLNTGGVGQFSSAISQLASINTASFAESFAGISGQMASMGSTITSGLAKGVTSSKSILIGAISSMIKTALSKVKSQGSAFSSAGRTLATNLGSGISSGKSSASSAASSVASSAVTSAKGQYNAMYNAGYYLAQGFANGIKAGEYWVKIAGKEIGEAALKAAKAALQEKSPSKKAFKIGAYFTEGFANGISDKTSMAVKSSDSMAKSTLLTVQDAIAKAGDLIGSGVDAQPTIRPIVDLTDVKTGAAAVSGLFSSVQTVGVRSNLNAINVAMNSKPQNGSNDDIISAINKLGDGLENNRGDTYNFGNFTYDDGSEVTNAVGTLIRYAKIGRRV